MLPVPWRIRRRQRNTRDTFTIDLEPPSGKRYPFLPGQFNMLYVFGTGEVPISMSGDPANAGIMTHTVRAVGTVTRVMSKLSRGAAVGVRGPFGAPWPLAEAKGMDVVVVAGGIGLAPLRPLICQLLSRRDDYRRVALLYGARTPGDILYRRDWQKWRRQVGIEVEITVDSVAPGEKWDGNVGVVPALIARAGFDPGNVVAMICGPEVMMRFAILEFRRRGVKDDSIYLSMERNMKCAIGFCGHCQFGPTFICKDGPVFGLDLIDPWISKREI